MQIEDLTYLWNNIFCMLFHNIQWHKTIQFIHWWIFFFFFCSLQGFAFISFHRREDASRAIAGVSGFGYDHLILNVEWAK